MGSKAERNYRFLTRIKMAAETTAQRSARKEKAEGLRAQQRDRGETRRQPLAKAPLRRRCFKTRINIGSAMFFDSSTT